jgi:hypothetical protein
MAADPKPTWSLLAKQLQVSKQSIARWRGLPGAPTEPDAPVWRAFIAENGLGVAGNRLSKQRESLLASSVEKKNRLLDIEIAQKERKTIERADVNKLLLRVASQQRAVLYAALEREYPGKVVGRTAAEVSLRGRELADRVCEIMDREIETWQSHD